ncbi:HMA2 domain-containing protein [Shewanella putrefaciens]|uniref:HMA2 domain-containing protein n=1 Tax=Shewanella putrefaciens TaxID=24 RepID=UPI002859E67B|nr:hypothetical protein [Shewanella putrefaciens]MDR6962411.1 hypothetical protein [Shewanella putrefaciens]
MNKLEKLRELTEHILVAHHVPGRIRLKLKSHLPDNLNLKGFKHTQQLLRFMESIPGVKSIRPNMLARSCVVEYDTKVLNASLWESLLKAEDKPNVIALLDEVEQHFQWFKTQNT